jgi:hypothetical protein
MFWALQSVAMETAQPPKFRRIASGDYETADGRFRLYQLMDVRPAAWNVEDVKALSLIVDGAATKRDALALFADWWTTQTPTKGSR